MMTEKALLNLDRTQVLIRGILVLFLLIAMAARLRPLLSRLYSTLGLVRWNKLTLNPDLTMPLAQDEGELHKVMHIMKQAVKWDENNSAAHRVLGYAYDEMGLNEAALSEWRMAESTAQDFIAIGESAREAGRLNIALDWYRRAMKLEPGLSDPWYFVGLAHQGAKLWDEALEAYQHAIILDTFSGPTLGLGSVYRRVGEVHYELGQFDKSLLAYQAAIEAGSFGSQGEEADVHYKKAEILLWIKNDLDACIVESREVLRIDPRHYHAHILLGVAYYRKSGDLAAAEEEIRLAIEILPTSKWAYRHLGDVYSTAGEYDQAISMYEEVLELDPQDSQAHVLLGVIYYRMGDVERAKAEVQIAVRLSPTNVWAYRHLGDIYRMEGACEEAIEMYRMVLELAPGDVQAQTYLQELVEEGVENK